MSAKKFISELERRKFLSDRLMVKLRESLAATKSPLSAEALANSLVQKKHLSQQQANDVLSGLSRSGVNLVEEDEDDNDDAEGSSIFAPHIIGVGKKKNTPPDDDDLPVLGMVPPAEQPRPKRRNAPPVARLAELGDVADTNELVEVEALPDSEQLADSPPIARRATGLSRGGKKNAKKKAKSTKDKKRWDSPVILIGGGGLVFLLLAGGTISWLLNSQSGDQKLALAREAAKSGAYPQAIEHYQDFLTTSPRHPEHSLARVQLAMVRIRQPTEANEFARALTAAETELKAIEDEEAFPDSHEESAALLPQIAAGLAKQAEQAAPTSEDSKKLVELANKALELCNNASYVPKALRDETKLVNVRDTLERVEHRQQSQLALAEGLKAMQQAIADAKPLDSYATHMKLLKDHPELADDAGLKDAIKKTTTAEQAAIRFVKEQKAAETAERPTPWVTALAVANRHGGAPAATGAAGAACVRVDGAVYGLDAATGRLLWRRYVGFRSTGWPILIDHDVIIADTVRPELLRLDAATGKLLWRQTIGEPFAEPLLVGDRGFVAAESGRLYVIDLKSGARTGYLQCTQPLHVAPAIDRLKTHLYLAGDRASVYAISLADMSCIGVYFLGHAPGAIQAAPVVVMDKLAVAENNGVETSRLHLLSADDKYAIAKQQADRRLNGLVNTPPLSSGRSLIVVTDRGQIEVYDISAGNEGEALTLVATRDAAGTQPLMRHVAVIGRNIWVADTQLTKYNIVPTNNRLPVEEIENNFAGATFDHPLAAFGETLIHVHRPKDRAGAVVMAIDAKHGHTLWESDLAAPLAGAPVVDDSAKALTIATATGYAFRFDEAAIRSRVQDQPLAAQLAPPQPPTLTSAVDLGHGRAVFSAANSAQLLLYDPAKGAKWIQLEGPLACAPTPLGQGFLAPLKIGQVFFLNSVDGARLATPFQPRVEPQSTLAYTPAGVLKGNARQFVITDGGAGIFLVALVDQPQPHLEAVKTADAGPHPIGSPVVVLGETAIAVAGDTRLMRFRLPALEAAGETNLPAPAEWGPYPVGDIALLATADQKLLATTATGEPRWQVPLEHGQLAGPPLVLPDSVLLAYRKGIVERRAIADGKSLGTLNVEQPLATGPVAFLQKIVVAAGDGTLLVIDQP